VFYDNFLRLCNQKGISPTSAVMEMGFQKSVVTRWKKSIPTDANKLKIAQYFGVSVAELMSGQKGKPSGKAEGQEVTFDDFTYALHDETKELTEENKQKLLEMARFFKEQQDKKKKQ